MAWFAKPKTKKEQVEEQRRRRRGEGVVMSAPWFNLRLLMGVGAFILMAWAVWLICFAGLSTVTQQIVASQRARVRVVAAFPFTYQSELQTKQKRELAAEMVGPYFKAPDMSRDEQMKQAVNELESSIAQYLKDTDGKSPEEQEAARKKLASDFTAKTSFELGPDEVASLAAIKDSSQLTRAFAEALDKVHGLLDRGIFDPSQLGLLPAVAQSVPTNINITGRNGGPPVLTQQAALNQFHTSLAPFDLEPDAKGAIYDLLSQAFAPNIQFDKEHTDLAKNEAMNTSPVVVNVRAGQVLADPNAPDYDSDLTQEALNAYYNTLSQKGDGSLATSQVPSLRFLYTTLLLLAAVIFIKCGVGPAARTPKFFSLGASLLLVNLALIRLVAALGSTGIFTHSPEYLSVLPWLAPTMLAPIIMTVMAGAAPAVLMSLLISMLFAMMTGDTLEIFLFSFLASLVAVYFSREVRLRAKLVRAGLLGGAAAAVCAIYLGVLNQSSVSSADVGRQIFVALLTGLLTSVAAIGFLPVCEHVFKITTDITLLELTDFNHPLLRKLQVSAPGTYHHSLMVANLSERAAAEAGANPLLCRACALYHDIGKIVKPEYFTENQRDGFNPHEEVSPSMSALIIKSHITEGLALAKQYKLPQIVREVIAQHHGTTLIKYFYHKAAKQQRLLTNSPFGKKLAMEAKAPANDKAAERDEPAIDESFYRYDGPKPNFKESAIIALADCVEAASRSLRKVTPQSVEELIETIINDRIEDHQLDDSPITILELKRIKASFTSTTINMLHSRISYPGQDETDTTTRGRPKDKNIVPMTPPTPPVPASGESTAANGSPSSASA